MNAGLVLSLSITANNLLFQKEPFDSLKSASYVQSNALPEADFFPYIFMASKFSKESL